MIKNKINNNYEKYQDDLLLHSMSNYIFQIKSILEVLKPKSISEIGIEGGKFSKYLLDYAVKNGLHYIGVEPSPSEKIKELIGSYNQTLIEAISLDEKAKDALGCDVIFIDGDHNYYTVYNELKIAYDRNPDSVMFLHDVSWPWGRRDLYYNVHALKKEVMQPYTHEGGLVPGKSEPQDIGFSSERNYAVAIDDGGERNGVLTAIEDFKEEHQGYRYMELLSVFGLGILYREESFNKEQLEFFKFFKKSLNLWNPLFVNLEENRLELLIAMWKLHKVIDNQNEVIDNQNKVIDSFLWTKIKKIIKKVFLHD